MNEIASLQIKIDSTPINQTVKALKFLEDQARATEQETNKLQKLKLGPQATKASNRLTKTLKEVAKDAEKASSRIKTYGSAANSASAGVNKAAGATERLNKDLDKTKKKAKSAGNATSALSEGFRTLRSAIVAYIGAQGVRFLADIADEATNARNRLQAITSSTEELNSVFDDLARVSTDSRVSLQTSANLYQRMSMGTEHLGVSQERLVRLTETINKSFKISGATADEASGSIRQLTQAFNANMLRGEELNSINEQAPILMKAIEKQLGMTGKELRKFAETGGITAEMMVAAFERIESEVDIKFAKTAKTIEDKLLDIRREFVLWADQNEGLADSFDILILTLDRTSVAARALLDQMGLASTEMKEFGEAVMTFVESSKAISEFFDSTKKALGDQDSALAKFWEGLKGITDIANPLKVAENGFKGLTKATKSFTATEEKLVKKIIMLKSQISVATDKLVAQGIVGNELREELKPLTDQLGVLADQYEYLQEKSSEATEKLYEQSEKLGNQDKVFIAINEEIAAMAKRGRSFQEHIKDIKAETEAYKGGEKALEKYLETKKIDALVTQSIKELRKEKVIVLQHEIDKIEATIRANEAAKKAYKDKIAEEIAADKKRAKEKAQATAKELADEKALNDWFKKMDADRDKEAAAEAKRKKDAIDDFEKLKRELEGVTDEQEEFNKSLKILEGQVGRIGEKEFERLKKLLIDMNTETKTFADGLMEWLDVSEEVADGIADAFGTVFSELDKEIEGLGTALSTIGDVMANGGFGKISLANSGALGVAGGTMLGNQMGGEYAGVGSALGSAGGSVLASLGTAAAPLLGPFAPFAPLIGGLLGGALGGMFGGEESDMTQSVFVDVGKGTIEQGGFDDDRFSAENRRTADASADAILGLMEAIKSVTGESVSGVYNLNVGSRDGIDLRINDELVLDNADELSEAMDLIFEDMLVQAGIASEVYKELAEDGEGFTETFFRVEAQFNAVNAAAELIGFNFGVVGDEGLEAADALVLAAGGLDAFIAKTQFFYNNFFTEQERFEQNLGSLKDSLSEAGLELPETRAGFKELVVGLEEAGEAGADTLATLLDLAPSAAQYFTQIEKWEGQLTTLYSKLLEREPDGAGLEHWLDQLESGAMSIEDITEALSNSAEAQELLVKESEEAAESTSVLNAVLNGTTGIVDDTATSMQLFLTEAEQMGPAIQDISDEMRKLIDQANEFAGGLAREALMSGMTDQEIALFNLDEWRMGAESELQGFADAGVDILGGPAKVLEDIETIYNKRLGDINDRYKENVEVFEEAEDVISSVNEVVEESNRVNEEALLLEEQRVQALKAVTDAYQDELRELDNFASKMGAFADDLRGFERDLLLGDLSTLSPQQQYQEAQRNFRSVANAAQMGDLTAIGNLRSAGETLLQESQEFQGSAGNYADDFDMVRQAVSNTADLAERQEAAAGRQANLLESQLTSLQGADTKLESLQAAMLALVQIQQESGTQNLEEFRKQSTALIGILANSDLERAAS